MKTGILITSESLAEAHILKGRLLNEGIDCFLTNENFVNLMPLCNNMLGSGIQIIVLEKDREKAREINLDLICANCSSQNIGLGLGKRKGFTIFNIIIALLSAFPMGNLKLKYYCKDCKTEVY